MASCSRNSPRRPGAMSQPNGNRASRTVTPNNLPYPIATCPVPLHSRPKWVKSRTFEWPIQRRSVGKWRRKRPTIQVLGGQGRMASIRPAHVVIEPNTNRSAGQSAREIIDRIVPSETRIVPPRRSAIGLPAHARLVSVTCPVPLKSIDKVALRSNRPASGLRASMRIAPASRAKSILLIVILPSESGSLSGGDGYRPLISKVPPRASPLTL